MERDECEHGHLRRKCSECDMADELARLREAVADARSRLNAYWSFDNDQRHTHTWHTKQDFLAWWDRYFAKDKAALDAAGEVG